MSSGAEVCWLLAEKLNRMVAQPVWRIAFTAIMHSSCFAVTKIGRGGAADAASRWHGSAASALSLPHHWVLSPVGGTCQARLPYSDASCPCLLHPVSPPADLELLEGLDKSKHGERAMAVAALMKEMEEASHNGSATARVRVTAVPSLMGDSS